MALARRLTGAFFGASPSCSPAGQEPLEINRFLREADHNGQVISDLLLSICQKEKPKRLLFVRTPTTGQWLEGLPIPKEIEVETVTYVDPRQEIPPDASFLGRNEFCLLMRSMASRSERFDVIAIDSFHDYASSLLDFELCIECLAEHGVLLSHDCAPERPDLAEPIFRPGPWCGSTYASLANFAYSHPELAFTVLDTDTGVGIVRRRRSKLRARWLQPAPLDEAKQEDLYSLVNSGDFAAAFRFFRAHAPLLVDLRPRKVTQPSATHDTPKQNETAGSARKQPIKIAIQEGAHLLVFRKDLNIGSGPAISVYVHESEVLKFDCYGPGKGHFHVQPNMHCRIALKEQSRKQQARRALFEIEANIMTYLSWSSNKEVSAFVFDAKALKAALAKARRTLKRYVNVYQSP
jgi:hypothetical protein